MGTSGWIPAFAGMTMFILAACQPDVHPTDRSLLHVVEILPHEFVIPAHSSITVRFSRKLFAGAVTPKSVQLLDEQSDKPVAIQTDLNADGDGIQITPDEPLREGQSYEIMLSSALRDHMGRPLGDGGGQKRNWAIHFQTARKAVQLKSEVADDSPLIYDNNPVVTSYEKRSTVVLRGNKRADEKIWFGRVGGPLNCLGQPCPKRFHDGEVELTGLMAGQRYRYAIRGADLSGHVLHFEAEWLSEPMPKVEIAEIVSKGEASFVKLINNSEEPVDLKDYLLAVRSASGNWRTCPLANAGDNWKLAPGAIALLTGQRFSDSYYHLALAEQIHRMKTVYVCGPLGSVGQTVLLKDGKGRVVWQVTINGQR